MKIVSECPNTEGYVTAFCKKGSKVRACYYHGADGFDELGAVARTISNEYYVSDRNLFSAIGKLAPDSSDHEKYFAYLAIRHPTYSYH